MKTITVTAFFGQGPTKKPAGERKIQIPETFKEATSLPGWGEAKTLEFAARSVVIDTQRDIRGKKVKDPRLVQVESLDDKELDELLALRKRLLKEKEDAAAAKAKAPKKAAKRRRNGKVTDITPSEVQQDAEGGAVEVTEEK